MKSFLVLLLLPLQLFSQDLSGIWKGTIATSETQMPFELAINKDMTGYSMITFMYKGTEKIAVKKITLIRKDSTYNISDDKLIYNNFTTRSRSIKTFCELSVKTVDSVMVLSGAFHTRTRDLRAGDEDLSTGTITLQKQNLQAQTRLISKLDSLKLSNTLAFSDPKAAIKANPIAAVSEREAPAAAESSEKDLTAVKVQQNVTTVPPIPATPKAIAPAAEILSHKTDSTPEAAIKANPVPAISEKEAPAAAGSPDKDLTAVKVRQKLSAAEGRNEPNSLAPNAISTVPPIPATPKIIAPAADILSRKTEVIRTIDFKSDSLTLVLYDNGIVDGDTVSVVLNDEVIIPKQRLEEQAYRKVIQMPSSLGDSMQLVIYAENLGTIPPNSGLLIIEDGSARYEVGFEGDLKKSAAVRLRRRR
jgi:hypothetical protein